MFSQLLAQGELARLPLPAVILPEALLAFHPSASEETTAFWQPRIAREPILARHPFDEFVREQESHMPINSFNLMSRSATTTLRLGVGVFFFVVLLVPFIVHSRATEPKPEIRILFIGNSFTYYYDLPRMVAELAEAGRQRPLHYESETPGGYTLEKHWQDRKAVSRIQSGHWDFVVLQDQSEAPLLRRDAMIEYGKKFDAEIKKQRAKTILYETWALQNKLEQQTPISKAYEGLSRELNARLAPVGNAWQTALRSDTKLILHDNDHKHPNATGTYLAACVFYATIFGKSPEGLPGRIGGLTNAEAQRLQAIAWKSVQAAGK